MGTHQISDAKDAQEQAFASLNKQAARLAAANTTEVEFRIWQGIILASHANARGGLAALPLVEQARDLLLAAEKTAERAKNPSTYLSLGSIYYQVPGWPVSFGDDDKAQRYLEKALALAPEALGSVGVWAWAATEARLAQSKERDAWLGHSQ